MGDTRCYARFGPAAKGTKIYGMAGHGRNSYYGME